MGCGLSLAEYLLGQGGVMKMTPLFSLLLILMTVLMTTPSYAEDSNFDGEDEGTELILA